MKLMAKKVTLASLESRPLTHIVERMQLRRGVTLSPSEKSSLKGDELTIFCQGGLILTSRYSGSLESHVRVATNGPGMVWDYASELAQGWFDMEGGERSDDLSLLLLSEEKYLELVGSFERGLDSVLDKYQLGGLKLYIAGPMRGKLERNYPMFDEAAALAQGLGHEAFNPADRARLEFGICSDDDLTEETLQAALLADFRDLLECDGIVLLPGWEESEGARAEEMIARMTGKARYLYLRSAKGLEPLR